MTSGSLIDFLPGFPRGSFFLGLVGIGLVGFPPHPPPPICVLINCGWLNELPPQKPPF